MHIMLLSLSQDELIFCGFYISPTWSPTVNASQHLTMTWDDTCLPGTSSVDTYLYAPSLDESQLQIWQGANFTPGSLVCLILSLSFYETELMIYFNL